MANDDAQGVLITRGSARRLKRLADRLDGTGGGPPPRGVGGAPWSYGLVRARATSTIGEGTFDEMGDGQAQIVHFNQASGEWEDAGDPVDVLNQFSGGDILERTALLLAWVSGFWLVAAAGCEPDPEDEEE